MGKVKSFSAKVAHDLSDEGKQICPVCKTEIKRVKIVGNKKGGAGWTPRYDFVKLCKCNEADFLAGKTL
ncbi:MAG: hypothetical protein GX122_05800 [Candidatus Cloacimonetes bacterium]|nr:hypothetical protein [Candidatus Cloacimonadota bacterium]NLK50423.1 hypothetical protein [Candidatus Cloacimonadota bacterium]NLO11913.1 hypothetical protein [Candidatus Cloacimonadota bacterium]